MAIHSIICKSCGANEFSEQNGLYVCKMCGTKHILSDDGNTVNIFVDGKFLTMNEQYVAAKNAYIAGNYQEALSLYTILNKNYPLHWEPCYYIKLIHFLTFNSDTDFKGQRELFIEGLPALFELVRNNYDVLDRHSAIIEICSQFRLFCDKIDNVFDKRDNRLVNVRADKLTSKKEIDTEINKQCSRRLEIVMLVNDFRNYILANFPQDKEIHVIAYKLIQYIVDEYASYYRDFVELQPETENFFWQSFDLLSESYKNVVYNRYDIRDFVNPNSINNISSNNTSSVDSPKDAAIGCLGFVFIIFIIYWVIKLLFMLFD